jgi:outer membrane protein OmpA-like peptidoglycan-associated protein
MKIYHFIFTAIIFISFSFNSYAQFDNLIDKVKDKVEEKVEDKVIQKTGDAVDKTLSGDDKKKEEQKNKEVKKEETKTTDVSKQKEEDLKVYSKFDFVPGDQVIFYEDFSQDNVGDFPGKWNTNGSGEIVTFNKYPGKWLNMKMNGAFVPELKNKFPDNFTIEYDMIYQCQPSREVGSAMELDLISQRSGDQIDGLVPGNGGFAIQATNFTCTAFNWKDGIYDLNNGKDLTTLGDFNGKPVRVSIWVQKQRVRVYFNESKIYDVPRLIPSGLVLDRVRFLEGGEQEGFELYISNFRIAFGAPDTRNKLITEGKFVTTGIHFDSGSDKIKADSYGTLKEIAGVLKDNSTVKVKIVGHTDTDGNEKSNLDLSKRRAASIKNSLSGEFGIDASRMETDGKGQTQPVSDNKTTEGKANNRRVEFIKI